MGAAFAGELRGFGGGYPTEKLPTGMARGSLPVGGGQAAVHRRRDLAVKGLFRAGAPRAKSLGGLLTRLAAKVAAYIVGQVLNERLGPPLRGFAELLI